MTHWVRNWRTDISVDRKHTVQLARLSAALFQGGGAAVWQTRASCQAGAEVRVAKGQWAETNGRGNDPRRGCLEVIEALAGRAPKVAVATHDPILAREAIRKLLASGTPCELELLFGLPTRAVLAVRRKLRVPVRFYIPYGHAWLPYAVRQAAKNPRIFWWMLRDACLGAR